MIGDYGDSAFCPLVDDHQGAVIDFDPLFTFRHECEFLRAAFGPVYLAEKKITGFDKSSMAVAFEEALG